MKFIYLFFLFNIYNSLFGQVITTVAGNGTYGYSGDGGAATSAQLAWCVGITTDNGGNIYIADVDNNAIRKVNSAGVISTFAGNGTLGYSGDGGPATSAALYHPSWVSIDNLGNIYFTDQNADIIRKINTAGIISTVTGNLGLGYSGDGGPLIAAQFRSIAGIAFDLLNNMYISDNGNNVVREVNSAGIITTVAGNGVREFSGDGGPATLAGLSSPYKVVFDNAGNMYIPDEGNFRIRKINSAGIITTIAGNGILGYSGDGGQAINAAISYPWTIAIDNTNNIYIGDPLNYVVRKVNTAGVISTYAGNGTYGNTGDGGPATSAELGEVSGLSVDNAGNVFVCIRNYFFVVKKITNCITATVDLQPVDAALCSSGDTSFTINASNVTNYQWQVYTLTGWSDLVNNGIYSGATANQLKITGAGTSMDSFQYRCSAINACGNIYSSTATLHVTTPSQPSIAISTPKDTICAGTTVTFSASAINGGTAPFYQWEKNGINVATGNIFSSGAIADGDVITCVLTPNSNCVSTTLAISNAITVKVNPVLTPSISISASATSICLGIPVIFTSVSNNAGSSPFYQWEKNGINTGNNSPTYIDSTLNNNDTITCALSPGYSCLSQPSAGSNRIIIKVTPNITPSVSITSSATAICKGASVSFTAVAVNGGSSPVYRWKKNGIPAGFDSIVYTDAAILDGDIITCTVTSNAACLASASAISNPVTVTVFNNPVVMLDKTSTLCAGGSRLLDAGNYNAWLWNNGSTARTLLINNTGMYYVKVTDNNGCTATDTTVITGFLPAPEGFLPKGDSICSYGTLVLQANSPYKSYLWSTNSIASSITVNTPGQYWLRVTDDNNCTGQDYVTIALKNCLEGFYIPDAFTPNHDGMNDVFKPLLFGNVKNYRFIIYNRFGQKVFESSDKSIGWDGTMKGIVQDNDIFVWICSYEFSGSSQEIKRGSVMLIR